MANMSYCRFENTVNDLSDCLDALNDYVERAEEPTSRRSHGIPSVSEFKESLSSDYERRAFVRLIDIARDLISLVDEMDM